MSNTKSENDFTLGPANEFMRSLWQLNHALARVSRKMEVASGVTAQQRMMIRCVGKYPGMTASQLAMHFHLDAGTVSTALDRLEQKGLVERRRGPKDRRRVMLGLTAAGRAIDAQEAGAVEHAVDVLLAALSTDDVARALHVLGTLTSILETTNRDLAVSPDSTRLAPKNNPRAPRRNRRST